MPQKAPRVAELNCWTQQITGDEDRPLYDEEVQGPKWKNGSNRTEHYTFLMHKEPETATKKHCWAILTETKHNKTFIFLPCTKYI